MYNDHYSLDRRDVIASYLKGKLTLADRTEFEAHFKSCRRCSDQLAVARASEARGDTFENVDVQRHKSRKRRLFHRLRLVKTPKLKYLIIAVGVAVLVTVQIKDHKDKGRLQTELSQLVEIDNHKDQDISRLEGRQQDLSTELQELKRQRQQMAKDEHLNKNNQQISNPQINIPIVSLTSVRGGGADSIRVPGSQEQFVLAIGLESAIKYRRYRATISSDDGGKIWKRDGLIADQYDSLTMMFSKKFFNQGRYLLTLEGISGDGTVTTIANYPFQISAK